MVNNRGREKTYLSFQITYNAQGKNKNKHGRFSLKQKISFYKKGGEESRDT